MKKAVELEGIAQELGVPLAQMAIGWCLKNPNVSTVILGTSNARQLAQYLTSLALVKEIGNGEWDTIESAAV